MHHWHLIKVRLQKSTPERSDKVPLGCKEEIDKLKKAKDATSKKLGEVIVERDFVVDEVPLEGKSSRAWCPLMYERKLRILSSTYHLINNSSYWVFLKQHITMNQ